MIKYTVTDIIKRAEQLADLENADFISWKENFDLINEAWRSLYQDTINNGDSYNITILDKDRWNVAPNVYTIPNDFYQLKSIIDKGTGIALIRREPTQTDLQNNTYELVNNQLKVYTNADVEITYYRQPKVLYLTSQPNEVEMDTLLEIIRDENIYTLLNSKRLMLSFNNDQLLVLYRYQEDTGSEKVNHTNLYLIDNNQILKELDVSDIDGYYTDNEDTTITNITLTNDWFSVNNNIELTAWRISTDEKVSYTLKVNVTYASNVQNADNVEKANIVENAETVTHADEYKTLVENAETVTYAEKVTEVNHADSVTTAINTLVQAQTVQEAQYVENVKTVNNANVVANTNTATNIQTAQKVDTAQAVTMAETIDNVNTVNTATNLTTAENVTNVTYADTVTETQTVNKADNVTDTENVNTANKVVTTTTVENANNVINVAQTTSVDNAVSVNNATTVENAGNISGVIQNTSNVQNVDNVMNAKKVTNAEVIEQFTLLAPYDYIIHDKQSALNIPDDVKNIILLKVDTNEEITIDLKGFTNTTGATAAQWNSALNTDVYIEE